MRNLLEGGDGIHEVLYFKDRASRFLLVSKGWVDAVAPGHGPDEFIGKTDFDVFSEPHARAAFEDEQRIIRTGKPMLGRLQAETYKNRPDEWVLANKQALREDGRIVGTFGISRNVTAQVRAEQEIVRRESQLRAVLDSTPDAIACYGPDLRYEMVNPQAAALLGAAPDEVVGRTDEELGRPTEVLVPLLNGLQRVLATKSMTEVEYSTRAGGTYRWFNVRLVPQVAPGGDLTGVITATRDLTELKQVQNVLAHQALHDPLTGLVNRLALIDRLNRSLAQLERAPGRVAVMFIDLDNFKLVNDVRGHDVGDKLLVEMARRLARVTRRADTVARLGGDEFVMLFDRLAAKDDAQLVAARVLRALSRPFVDKGTELAVTASIGVVVTDDPQANARELLRNADGAMYQAKRRGRNRVELFDPLLGDGGDENRALGLELKGALDHGQFFLDYQPLFSLEDKYCSLAGKRVVGAEALVRWDHPRRGVVPPVEFISLAEELGLINTLGTWVLGEACRQVSEWRSRGEAGEDFVMAVNVSARQLADPGFASIVSGAIAGHGLSAAQLCLEITETGMIEELDRSRDTLDALAAMGVRVALDDFGTGYSSLAHLHNFRVNTLKIDRSFVERLGGGGSSKAIVAGVIAMAHALGMAVVAEGVETEEQLCTVANMGCDEAQGFLFARPLSPGALALLLAAQDPSTLSA